MKHLYQLIALCAIISVMSGCTDTGKIDYLPVQVDKGDNWGFINAKGEVFLADEYENMPSMVKEGVFSVLEGKTLSLYKFDEKKPKLILSDLIYVGEPEDGLLPVTRKDSKIEIVDLDGKTVFTLEKVDGKSVTRCGTRFRYGCLSVFVIDGDEELVGVVDRKGEVVLNPKYNSVKYIADNLFFVTEPQDDDDDEEKAGYFVNKKGEKQKEWKVDAESSVYEVDGYVVITRAERCHIYDLKGEEVLKCKEEVKYVSAIKNGLVVVTNDDDKAGVVDFNGDRIMSLKFENIVITDEGFLAKREGKETFEFYNKNGEREEETEWENVMYLEGFGLLAEETVSYERGYQYIVDNKGKEIHKNDMHNITSGRFITIVESDYFDCGEITELMLDGINKDLSNHGVTLGGLITSCDIESSDVGSSACTYPYSKGVKYFMQLVLVSDVNLRRPVYGRRPVQRYSYWYGYYTDYESYIDHYEPNPEARVEVYAFSVKTPDEKRNKLYDFVCQKFASKFNKQDDSYFKMGELHLLVQKYSTDVVNVLVSNSSLMDYRHDNYSDYEEEAAAEEAVEEVVEEDY